MVAPRSRTPLQLVVPVDGTPHVAGPVAIAGASGRPVEVRYDLPPLRRGEHVLGPLRTRIADPLELVHRERTVAEASRVLVHPRRHTMHAVPVAFDRDMDGPVPPIVVRDGQADAGLKAYETGDDLRLIHAPASRRRGTLLLRRRIVADASGVVVVFDTSVGGYVTDDDFENAVSVAASVCVASATGDRPLALRATTGPPLAGGRGAAVRIPALDALARVARRADDAGLARLPALLGGTADHAVVVVTGAPSARGAGYCCRVVPGHIRIATGDGTGSDPGTRWVHHPHAWAEVHIEEIGWVTFHTTTLADVRATQPPLSSLARASGSGLAWERATPGQRLALIASAAASSLLLRLVAASLLMLLGFALTAALAVLVVAPPLSAALRWLQRNRRPRHGDPAQRIASAWREMVDLLLLRRVAVSPASTTDDVVGAAHAALGGAAANAIAALAPLVSDACFAPRAPTAGDARRTCALEGVARRHLLRDATPWQRLRILSDPRPLWWDRGPRRLVASS